MTEKAKLDLVAERAWQYKLAQSPYLQLRNGVTVTGLPVGSLEEAEADADFARGLLAELAAVKTDGLAEDDLQTLGFLRFELGSLAESAERWWTLFPVAPYQTFFLGLYGQLLFAPFSFENPGDADRYLSLMRDYATALRAMLARVKAQAGRGWLVPRPALPGVRATLTGLKSAASGIFRIDDGRTKTMRTMDANAFKDREAAIYDREIAPAFDALLASLDNDYEARAPETVGMGQYPGGEEAYRQWMRYHLTFDTDAKTVHETGLEEVARLTEAMTDKRRELDFDGGEAEFAEHLVEAGRMHAASAEEVEATFMRHIGRIEPLIPRYFSVTPEAPYGVRRLDAAAEAGQSYGYYQPPTESETTGLYRYNGSGLETRSQINAAPLIFHELVPGHHFHIARQKENQDLPMLRREAIELTVFNEGWAEYSANLAGEMGLYDDPYDHYGHLIHQRFLAQRLVVDTGMNAFGWPLEKAREYMKANTLESDEQVATETLRYSTDMPGQALGYRLGFLKFTELRARAEAELGGAFDIRDFHEVVLGPGALPMTEVEASVDRYIVSKRREDNDG
jgi:uncharacterized protein (DUF885 family)